MIRLGLTRCLLASAIAACLSTPSFGDIIPPGAPQIGEIEVAGLIVREDRSRRRIQIDAKSVTLPDGTTTNFDKSRHKTVIVTPHTQISLSNPVADAMPDLAPGASIIAIGKNFGVGRPLTARVITANARIVAKLQAPTWQVVGANGHVTDFMAGGSVIKLIEAGVLPASQYGRFLGKDPETRYDFAVELCGVGDGRGLQTDSSAGKIPPTDVPAGEKVANAVNTVVMDWGIMTVYPDCTFGGTRILTRFECAQALYRLLVAFKLDAKFNASSAVSDIPTGSFDYKAAVSVVDSGVMPTFEDGTFRGDRPMTRNDAAVALANLVALAQAR